jgi:hypothetical protein
MSCNIIKSKFESYLDRTTSDHENREIEAHVNTCPDCRKALQAIKHIDALAKRLSFPEPPHQYWKTVPKIIVKRLGLRAEPSVVEQVAIFINEIFVSKSLRWGLTGAVSVLVLFFIFKAVGGFKKSDSFTTHEPVTIQETIPEDLILESPSTKAEVPLYSETRRNQKEIEEGVGETLTTKTEIGTETDVKEIDEMIIAKENVESLPPRKHQYEHSYFEEIIPVPQSELFSLNKYLDDSEDKTPKRVAATVGLQLGKDVTGSQQQNLSPADEFEEAQNNFAETLWIVQQMSALSEKRNIWLSYIGREKDPTYRSLGIYNLALVLSKQVEESNDPEKATEALNFYIEHEKSLRVQMGPKRYQLKIDIFNKVINRE